MNSTSRVEFERRMEENHREMQRILAHMLALLEEEIAESESAPDALPISIGDQSSSEDVSDAGEIVSTMESEDCDSSIDSMVDEILPPSGQTDSLSAMTFLVEAVMPTNDDDDTLTPMMMNPPNQDISNAHPSPSNSIYLHESSRQSSLPLQIPLQITVSVVNRCVFDEMPLRNGVPKTYLPHQFRDLVTRSEVPNTPIRLPPLKPPDQLTVSTSPLARPILMLPRRPPAKPPNQVHHAANDTSCLRTLNFRRSSLLSARDHNFSLHALKSCVVFYNELSSVSIHEERKLNALLNSKSDIVCKLIFKEMCVIATWPSLVAGSDKREQHTNDIDLVWKSFDQMSDRDYTSWIPKIASGSPSGFVAKVFQELCSIIIGIIEVCSSVLGCKPTSLFWESSEFWNCGNCSPSCYATLGSSSASHHVFVRELLPSIQIKVHCNAVYQLLLIYMVSKSNPQMSFQAMAAKPRVFDTRSKLPPPKPPVEVVILILQWKPLLLKLTPRPPAKQHDQVHQGIFSYLWGIEAYFSVLNRVIMSKRIRNSSYIGKMTTTVVIANVLKHFMHQYRLEVGLIQRLVSLDGCDCTIGICVLALNLIQVKITNALIVFKRLSYKDIVAIPAHHVLQPDLNSCEVAAETVTMILSSAVALPSPPPEPPDWDYCIVAATFAADKCTCWLESCATAIANDDKHVKVIRSLCNSVIKTFRFSFLLLEGSLTINHRTLQCEKVLFHIIVTHSSDFKLRSKAFHGDSKFSAISLPIVILSFVHFNAILCDTMGQLVSNKPRAMTIVDLSGFLFWDPSLMVFHDPIISEVPIVLVTTLTSLYIFEIVPTNFRDQLQNITHLVYNVALWDSRVFLERINSFGFVERLTIKDVEAWASLTVSCDQVGTDKLALSLFMGSLNFHSQIELFVMSFVMKVYSNLASYLSGKQAVWFWNATKANCGSTTIEVCVIKLNCFLEQDCHVEASEVFKEIVGRGLVVAIQYATLSCHPFSSSLLWYTCKIGSYGFQLDYMPVNASLRLMGYSVCCHGCIPNLVMRLLWEPVLTIRKYGNGIRAEVLIFFGVVLLS